MTVFLKTSASISTCTRGLSSVAASFSTLPTQLPDQSRKTRKRPTIAERLRQDGHTPPPYAVSESQSVANNIKDTNANIVSQLGRRPAGKARKGPAKPSAKRDTDPDGIHNYLPYTRQVEGLLRESVPAHEVLQDLESPSEHKPIAELEHGLDRVLFNPGVHWFRDPRSRVYNFDPPLEKIPKVTDFAFERLEGFVKSSSDNDLWTLAKREGKRFTGSTSSLTRILSHVYFLLSGNKPVDLSPLSQRYRDEPATFTPGQRMAAVVTLNYKEGVYSIDSTEDDPANKDGNILLWMGTVLEKYLTTKPEEFSTYLRSEPAPPATETMMREAYRYSMSKNMIMRSQLDGKDSRLPGTGVFDIKTRACLPIRMDILNFEENSGYQIRSQYGMLESFEREYYDLIRSAFLKYTFQARIGNMDGVFVAYHNTAKLFGFQYVPLEEMEERVYGSAAAGPRVFQKCVSMTELILNEIIKVFPEKSVKITMETSETNTPCMDIWVEPLDFLPDFEVQEKPLIQLKVTIGNYLNDRPCPDAHKPVIDTDAHWTVHWKIVHLSGAVETVRERLQKTLQRNYRPYSLPTGVSNEDVTSWWTALNFSGQMDEASRALAAPPLDRFVNADYKIRILRAVSREGRRDSDSMERLEERMRPVVLGDPESFANAGYNASLEPEAHEDDFMFSVERAEQSGMGELFGSYMTGTLESSSSFQPSEDDADRSFVDEDTPEDADLISAATNRIQSRMDSGIRVDMLDLSEGKVPTSDSIVLTQPTLGNIGGPGEDGTIMHLTSADLIVNEAAGESSIGLPQAEVVALDSTREEPYLSEPQAKPAAQASDNITVEECEASLIGLARVADPAKDGSGER